MIVAFFNLKTDKTPLSFLSEFNGYSLLRGDWSTLLSILDGGKKDEYEGSFLLDGCNLLEDEYTFVKIGIDGDKVTSTLELKEGINLDQLSAPLAKYQSDHTLSQEAAERLANAIKHIYNALLARPLFTILDLSRANPELKDQVNELSHLIFSHYPILVYSGEENGEPTITPYGEEPKKPSFPNDFEAFAYGEKAQQAGFHFFVSDITEAKKLNPGKMFVEAAAARAKRAKRKAEQQNGKGKYFLSSFKLNIPFALLFLLFGFISGFIFYFLAEGEYNGTVASIFSLLSPIFALMALMPIAFFYGDSAELNVLKNKLLFGGLAIIGGAGLLFGLIEFLFFRTTDFPLSNQLPFIAPLLLFPLIEAVFVFVLYLIRKKRQEVEE